MKQEKDRLPLDKGTKELHEKFHLVKRLMRRIMEKEFKDFKLTPPQMMILSILHHNNRMKVSDIGEQVGLSISTVSGILDRLESQDIIKRVRSDSDRRVVYVEISNKFREKGDTIRESFHGKMVNIFKNLNNQDFETVNRSLDILIKLFEEELAGQ